MGDDWGWIMAQEFGQDLLVAILGGAASAILAGWITDKRRAKVALFVIVCGLILFAWRPVSRITDGPSANHEQVALHEFRWKFQNAWNAAASTGDFTPLLHLSVNKHNMPKALQDMEKLSELWPKMMPQRNATSYVRFESWDAEFVTPTEVTVVTDAVFGGVDMGRRYEDRRTDKWKLVKIQGEWLFTASGPPE
jgi:hypothetical protein